MKNNENYYLGLDIGTDSVGYAATDKQYSLLKFHSEPAWGVTLFDEAKQASERRAFRINRRRLDRRQQRVRLLQELFALEIGKIDPRFFIRQQESTLYPADKQDKYALFNDVGFTDVQYHKKYPTIHHLINELMESSEPHDPRLIYLACAWLVAHRGHFLSQIDLSSVDAVTDFSSIYCSFREYLINQGCQIPWQEDNIDVFQSALCLDSSVSKKTKALAEALFPSQKVPKEEIESFPYSCDAIIRALAGGKVEAKKLFCQPAYADLEIKSFSLDMKEEEMAEFLSEIGEDSEMIVQLKSLYDWALLINVLGGDGQTISKAKIAVYEQHQKDLHWLKVFIRKYCPKEYSAVFKKAALDNYAAYSDHGTDEKTKKVNQEAFCKYLRGILSKVVPEECDKAQYDDAMARLETTHFMPKQKNSDNRVIPYQLYWVELDRLLKQAESYLSFLREKDKDGISVSDKIRKVFLFRVPYYIGPLGAYGENRWAIRKPGKITPWNFDSMVDHDKSEEAFIRRMTNTCTYLPGEDVLPKDSLLYHRFMVLNEINNLKINGESITVEQKQNLYNDVFLRYPKVTIKRIRDYLQSNNLLTKIDVLSGIDETVKSNLKPQHIFRSLLESGKLSAKDAETIIARRTYSEETGRFRRWLQANYPLLTKEEVSFLCQQSFKDFGRMSRRFLTELEGENRETGEITTIMQALWETNDNLMELLSERYSFAQAIEEEQRRWYAAHPQTIQEKLADMYIPTAVRRSVLRALEITKEVVKAFGKPPERIFVEMARGGKPEQKGKRTLSRFDQLTSLLDQCNSEDARQLKQQLEAMGDAANTKLQSEKLFLYYLQLGRCMYTGKPIDLQTLMKDKRYDIDHIFPQSLVKDDSPINNKVLVVSEENARKGNGLVPEDVQRSMRGIWEYLRSVGMMSDEKFRRLTRTLPFSVDEKWDFINRQLAETSQSTKAAASLLKDLYPDTEIVYVKARLTSEFRQAFDCIKSRDYNDLHHAKDAYLNIVNGNVYHEKFSRRWFSPDTAYSVKTTTIFTHPVVCGGSMVWDGTPMLEKVIATVTRNNAHITRYSYRKQGGFFDQQPVSKGPGLVPLKKGMDTERYGGYNKASISFFVLTSYTAGKKKDVVFLPVELLIADKFLSDPAFRLEYAKEKLGKIWGVHVQSVSFPLGERILRVNTMLALDGYCACITGSSSFGKVILLSGMMPFSAGYETERYIKRLASLNEKHANNSKYVYDPVEDKVTGDENLKLYDLYTNKLRNSVYRLRPNNPLETLENGRDTFKDLSVWEQITVLLNIHAIFGRLASGVNLTLIGGAAHAAASPKSSALSNWKKTNCDVRIIDRSASGLWETSSPNLLDLL